MLKERLNKVLKIDPIEIIREILSDRDILLWVQDKNKEQLKAGTNSNGEKLSDIGGEYSAITLDLYPDKVADRVNLLNSGEFYKTIIAKSNLFDLVEIDADPIKIEPDGRRTNLYNRWGKDIIGLNEENLQKLIDKVKNKLIVEIRKKI